LKNRWRFYIYLSVRLSLVFSPFSNLQSSNYILKSVDIWLCESQKKITVVADAILIWSDILMFDKKLFYNIFFNTFFSKCQVSIDLHKNLLSYGKFMLIDHLDFVSHFDFFCSNLFFIFFKDLNYQNISLHQEGSKKSSKSDEI
jgi:hypothetical protein